MLKREREKGQNNFKSVSAGTCFRSAFKLKSVFFLFVFSLCCRPAPELLMQRLQSGPELHRAVSCTSPGLQTPKQVSVNFLS